MTNRLDNLLPKIEGQAIEFVLLQLPSDVLNNYSELMSEMARCYRVIETNQSFVAKLSKRSQKQGEKGEVYAANPKRRYDKGHRDRHRGTRDEDFIKRFIDGLLDLKVKFEAEYHKKPRDVDEAVYHVVNFIQTRNGTRDERPPRFNTRRATSDQNNSEHNLKGVRTEEKNVKGYQDITGNLELPQKDHIKTLNKNKPVR